MSTQNIDYKKLGKSNANLYICKCHLCKNEIESLIHLFFRCHKIKHALDEVKHIFIYIFEKNIERFEEHFILGVHEGEITENLLLLNCVTCILKWEIWKTRNYIKYDQSIYREAIVIINFKNEIRSNIQIMIKNQEVRILYDIMKLLTVIIGYAMI